MSGGNPYRPACSPTQAYQEDDLDDYYEEAEEEEEPFVLHGRRAD